jgi:dihydropyrimidinase/dihydroorotase
MEVFTMSSPAAGNGARSDGGALGPETEVDLTVVNGQVVTPSGIRRVGIAVKDGRIMGLMDEALLPRSRKVIDARGRHVIPGVVDPESHAGHSFPLDLDARTESRAAAAAGITSWGIMNPSPRFGAEPWKEIAEPEDVVSFFNVFPRGREIWDTLSMVDSFFIFQLETDEQAEEIPRYAREMGVTSVKFYNHVKHIQRDTFWYAQRTGLARGFDDGTFFLACERAAEADAMVHFHPENWEIARILEKRLLDAGRTDMGAWDDRSPDFTEAHHVRSYSYFGKLTGCTMYVQHTTNPLTLYEIQRARDEGIKIYSQTGPAWLYFTRDAWRINTPLRSRESMEAIWAALRDGVIDCIGSDHVVAHGKRQEMMAEQVWSRKKSGFPSRVEMLVPVMLHEGVNKGRISLERMVEVCCSTPAKLFRLYPRKGIIAPGSDADLVIVDLNKEVTVQDEMIHSRPGWSLLTGHTLKGWPVMTILRGNVIAEWRDGAPRAEVLGEPLGRYIPKMEAQAEVAAV